MISIRLLSIISFVIAFFGFPVTSLSSNITIKLNKTITRDHLLFEDFMYLNRSSKIQINFSDVNKNISFIIFQVHSHLYNILVYKNADTKGTHISGTNVGLHSLAKPLTDTYYIVNLQSNVDLKLYVAVHGYEEMDPTPGGCNMEASQLISPYIETTNNKDYVYVDANPAKYMDDENCLRGDLITYIFRMIYLPEMNFDSDTYFAAIKSIMDVKNLRRNGRIIQETNYWKTRRVVSVYPGTGAIYIAIAWVENRFAMYVPAVSYGCSPLREGSCCMIDVIVLECLCAALFFIGLFICYFGHRFFKTEMFFMGSLSGFLTTYILISQIVLLDQSALILASALSAVFFGAIWLLFWWLYGIPVVAVLLPSLNVGFLLASIIYYGLPSFPANLLRNNLNFWSLFVFIILLTSLALVTFSYIGNILCCTILGGYASVFSLDFYIGSNLKYILINTLRRAIVTDFKIVVLMPPFQIRDILLTLLWVTLVVTGSLFQYHQSKGRPPFPPPPRSVRAEAPSYGAYTRFNSGRSDGSATIDPTETTPLLE